MTDMPGIRDAGGAPLHHQFLDAHIHAWTERQWPGARAAPVLDRPAARAFEATLGAVRRAAARDAVSGLLEVVTEGVLPDYRVLVAAEQEARRQAAERARNATKAPDASDPGTTPTEDEPEPQDASAKEAPDSPTGASASDEPAEADQPAPAATTQPLQSRRREGAPDAPEDRAPSSVTQGERRRWSRRQVRDRVLSSTGESWHPGLISYLRKGRGPQIDYEAFDYLAAVRKLDPLIRESIHGSGRRRGAGGDHGPAAPWGGGSVAATAQAAAGRHGRDRPGASGAPDYGSGVGVSAGGAGWHGRTGSGTLPARSCWISAGAWCSVGFRPRNSTGWWKRR